VPVSRQINNAVLLRTVCEQLIEHIIPALQTGDAVERARFSVMLLQRVAGRLDVFVEYSKAAIHDYRRLISALIETAAQRGHEELASRWRDGVTRLSTETGPIEAIENLRGFLVALIEDLSTPLNNWFHDGDSAPDIRELMTRLISTEKHWRSGYEAVFAAQPQGAPRSRSRMTTVKPVHELVTRQSTTRYFRSKLPESPDVEIEEVRILPGGRSKYTIFLSLTGTDAIPRQVVMRQDSGATMIPTTVLDEYPLLKSLHPHALHTAEPLYLEPEDNELGRPFMLVNRLAGKPPGDYFTFPEGNRAVVEEVARTLARMHQLDVTRIEIPQQRGKTHIQYTLDQVEYYRAQWHDNALEPSPVIEYAFAWLDRECRNGMGGPALVHGDIAPHNYLVQGQRLTGIVDWEFAHIGDPAEDLAYRRMFFEQFMSWNEFLDIYYAAGAAPVDERRLKMFAVWGYVRNASFGALGHREFRDGINPDFANAALSTYLYGYFDQQVAEALAAC
jgi:aminoglycoside phosphotransferase (APT) family kinase protein